jgi:hypothetical protein
MLGKRRGGSLFRATGPYGRVAATLSVVGDRRIRQRRSLSFDVGRVGPHELHSSNRVSPEFAFRVGCQLLAVLLSACVDDDGSFMAVVLAVWAVFWIGALALTKFRRSPSPAELVSLRFGPVAAC